MATTQTSRVVESVPIFDAARTIALAWLEPAAHRGVPGRVNRALVEACGETGLLDWLYPQADGESVPAAAATICALREAIGYVSAEAESAFAMQGLGGYPVLQSGQRHHKERWIPRLRSGTAIAGFALTEAGSGSDAGALELRADAEGDGWRLSGTKRWITNAPGADFYVTFARTTIGAGARGVTAFLIPADAPGLTITPIDLFAPHPIGELQFDSVAAAPSDVLGELDRGFRVAMRTLDLFRPSVGAAAIGMGQAALDAAVYHVSTRQAFGGPLSAKQAIGHELAERSTELEAARLLVQRAALAYDRSDTDVTSRAAMAKLFATEAAQRAIDTALQFHGASGLQSGHLMERLYREIRAMRIYEGASEIQRDIIARDLFARAASATNTTKEN